MNYTATYHLPQWEETDRIMRTDFNQMCADMEKGLRENSSDAGHAYRIADAARSTASSAVSMAEQAINKANTAQKAADNAMEKACAAFSPDQKSYAVGSYVGTGSRQNVTIGFRPSFMIITGQDEGAADRDILLATAEVNRPYIHFYSTYITLYNPADTTSYINIKDRTYYFIAFR